MEHRFQVDLRGVVDLLSHHLYASPRVYVRELLQNAVDAITARRARRAGRARPGASSSRSADGDGTLRVHDTGIGLTEAQVHELLATSAAAPSGTSSASPGTSSSASSASACCPASWSPTRSGSRTRSATEPTVRWTGFADGVYTIGTGRRLGRTGPPDADGRAGTTVTLRPRAGRRALARRPRSTELARLVRLAARRRHHGARSDDDGGHRAAAAVGGPVRRPGRARARPCSSTAGACSASPRST